MFKFPYRNIFTTYDEKKEAFIKMLRKLPDGISEVHIHPSIISEEIKDINPTWQERVLEYQVMIDDDIINEIKRLDIKLITYKDISKIKKSPNRIKAISYIINLCGIYSIKFFKKIIK